MEEKKLSLPDSVLNHLQPPIQNVAVELRCGYVLKKAKKILERRSLAEEDIKPSWWSYLRPLWHILRTFEKNNRGHATPRGLLLPLTSFCRRFILIDSDALFALFGLVNWAGHCRPTKADFDENLENWWQIAFRLKKVVTSGRRFAFSILTDGMSVSVNMKRRTSVWNGVNDHGFDRDGNYQTQMAE